MTTVTESGLPGVSEVDRELASIERDLDLLLNITPINAADAWEDFERSGFSAVPTLQSRPLGFDPDLELRRLFDLEIERVEDPSLARLLSEKRDEIARQITLLKDRDTSRFLHGSLALFGDLGLGLIEDAERLLQEIPDAPAKDSKVTATGFAEAAEKELEHYRDNYAGFDYGFEVRDDVSDLMVSHGRLMIPAAASFRSKRVAPLIHHEVGTHVLTFANGTRQPLKLLTVGLPDYEETQEGLAVLAEYLVGGLDPLRLRLLAARVIAIQRLLEGAGFLEIFEHLHESLGFPARTSWSVTIRVARSGGLTKDVIYLRGISRVLEFVAERQDLTPLLVGKLSLDHVPLIDELLERGVLQPPWLRPRWLDVPGAPERLQRLYGGMSVLDLIEKDAA